MPGYGNNSDHWKDIFINNHSTKSGPQKLLYYERKKDRKTIKNLERELRRKDKALAEVAVQVLTKKAQEIWGAEDD